MILLNDREYREKYHRRMLKKIESHIKNIGIVIAGVKTGGVKRG